MIKKTDLIKKQAKRDIYNIPKIQDLMVDNYIESPVPNSNNADFYKSMRNSATFYIKFRI